MLNSNKLHRLYAFVNASDPNVFEKARAEYDQKTFQHDAMYLVCIEGRTRVFHVLAPSREPSTTCGRYYDSKSVLLVRNEPTGLRLCGRCWNRIEVLHEREGGNSDLTP